MVATTTLLFLLNLPLLLLLLLLILSPPPSFFFPPFTFPWSLSGPIPGNLNQLGQAEASLPSFPPFRFRLPLFLPLPLFPSFSSFLIPNLSDIYRLAFYPTKIKCQGLIVSTFYIQFLNALYKFSILLLLNFRGFSSTLYFSILHRCSIISSVPLQYFNSCRGKIFK